MAKCYFIFISVFLICTEICALPWTPQLGTVAHSKVPDLSPRVRAGNVYMVEGGYYRALVDIDLGTDLEALENLPTEQNEYWRHIRRGSYLLPKSFTVDSICEEGDLFYDEDGDAYYRATTTGIVSNDWQSDVINLDQSACRWEVVNDKENWMGLLLPEIGDRRLGDILIPGSHDAGTSGIDENGILVDKHFLFQIGERLDPQFVANWSLTQPDKLDQQLLQGFRNLDLRVADTEEYDGQFRWWHGMSGDEISEGLDFIGEFARTHHEEVLVLDFQHFVAPGNVSYPTLPIPDHRLDMISDMILSTMGDSMAFRSNLSANPTINEVLATGRSIVAVMKVPYIQSKDDRYWDPVIHSDWVSRPNPEDLFRDRSEKLVDYKNFHADEMTDLSGCTTANEKILTAALVNVFGHNETMMELIEELFPRLPGINPSNMSFEGLWMDLLSKATYGTVTDGMRERPPDLYTNGASVHYSGVNEQARHWVARPDLYKPNIIYTDDFETSTLVDTAIEANAGNIVREVTIAHQGNPKNGYYEWDGLGTIGGMDGLNCSSIDVRYTILDQGSVLDQGVISEIGNIDLQEGFYPPGTVVEIDVKSESSTWQEFWAASIQGMIDTNSDVYIRGTDLSDTGPQNGFAYLSSTYDDYGEDCLLPPADMENVILYMEW